jgi:hypothetical protein
VASPIAAPFAGAAIAGSEPRNKLKRPAVANAINIERIPISLFEKWAARLDAFATVGEASA